MLSNQKKIEEKIDNLQDQIKILSESIKKDNETIKELQKFHALEAATLSFLVAIAVSGFTYWLSPKNFSTLQDAVFFTLITLGAFSAFILLLFHSYTVYGIFKGKNRKLPFSLDFIFFFYIIAGIPTGVFIAIIYDYFGINSEILSPGWIFVLCILLFIVLIGVILSKNINKKLLELFPSVFIDEEEEKKKKGVSMVLKEHWRKYKRLYKLEIYLLIPVIILGFITNFVSDSIQFYLYIGFFYLASWFFTVIPIELILVNISKKTKEKYNKRFKKKPKIFEYAFFLGLFWATALLTDAYSRNIRTGLDFFNFLNTFGAAIFCYGFASACGWYYYIERLDDD